MQKHKKILYDETEDKLFKYFDRENISRKLNNRLSILNKQIKNIEKELRECSYINIEEESSSPSFDERVQTSPNGVSYAENQVVKLTNFKLKRKFEKEMEKQYVLKELDDLETICDEMEWKTEDYKGELKKLLEMYYRDRKNELEIAAKLHLSQSQVNKRKNQIINHMIMWKGWGK